MENLTNEIYKDKDFLIIIQDLIDNETVKQMKNFKQHYETTCFGHCLTVSYITYKICRKFKLDYTSAARAAMLHDLFLYDWRQRQPNRKGLHAFTHGKTAYENASKTFDLNDKEKDMIIKHMWPVTPLLPKYIESFILTFVDKHCAMAESLEILTSKAFQRKSFRYAYLSACLLFVR